MKCAQEDCIIAHLNFHQVMTMIVQYVYILSTVIKVETGEIEDSKRWIAYNHEENKK